MINDLKSVSLPNVPEKTKTYNPISFNSLDVLVKEILNKEGYKIINSNYCLNNKRTQLFAQITLDVDHKYSNSVIGYRASYDKMISLGFMSGVELKSSGNYIFDGLINQQNKRGNSSIEELLYPVIDGLLNKLNFVEKRLVDKYYDLPCQKNIKEVIGDTIINSYNNQTASLTPNQLLLIAKNFYKKESFLTKMDMYNLLASPLKEGNPYTLPFQYKNLFNYFNSI